MANRSPPMPLPVGSIRPNAALAAIAASTAEPPCPMTSSAIWVASGCEVAAMACGAITSERVAKAWPVTRSAAGAAVASSRPRATREDRSAGMAGSPAGKAARQSILPAVRPGRAHGSSGSAFQQFAVAHRALVGACRQQRIGLQRGADLARTWFRRAPALRVLFAAAPSQLRLVHQQVDGACGDVDADAVAVAHQADGATSRRLGRGMADRQARGAAGETAIGQQRALLPQPLRLQVAGRVQHLLHAGTALRAFV